MLVRAGSNYTYTPVVNDTPGESFIFSLAQGPAAMTINTNTGALDWLPGMSDVGPNPVVIRATDAHGGSADQVFTLFVTTPSGPEIDLEPIAIVATNVTIDNQTLALGGTLHVRWRNNGGDPVPIPYTVAAFVDGDGDGTYSTNADRVVGYASAPAGLSQGFSAFADIPLAGQALFADAPLSVFVDNQQVVPEFNEGNNLKRSGFDVDTNNPPVLDVSASRLQLDRTGLPDRVWLTARLGNSGFVALPAGVSVAFYLGDPASGGSLLGRASLRAALPPGRFEDMSVTWSNPPIAKHMIFVVADDDGGGAGALTEITEANNRSSAEADLTFNDSPLADTGPDQSINLGDAAVLNGRASRDPEGKPLKYRWALVSIPINSHPQLGGAEAVQSSLQADAPGDYTVRLIVNDGVTDSAPDEFVVTVVDPNANHSPTLTSRPPFEGMVKVLYSYAVQASDPDGDTLHFRLPQSAAGMTINTNTGLIQFTPTNAGTFFGPVAVDDGRGATHFQSWSFNVVAFANLPPHFTATPVTTAAPGVAYTYDVDATDANLDNVTFALAQKPAGQFKLRATWTPPAGVNATLVPLGSPFQIYIQIFSQRLVYWEAAGIETPLEAFDFPGFTLTTQDGTQYRIEREDLGYHLFQGGPSAEAFVQAYGKAYLTRISELAGTRTELVRQRGVLKNIETYAAAAQRLQSVLFQRDGQNRVTAIYLPENLDSNGVPAGPASVTYEYDAAGNLARVNKLIDATNPGNLIHATTTYYSTHPRFPHLLTEVRDPRGVSVLRTEFDEAGRLIATLDAFGNRTAVTRDLAARTETIFDRLGNPMQLVYDPRGNVVAETDAMGQTIRRTFDANNRMTSETDKLGHSTSFTYDARGNRASVTDPLGNTTRYTYDSAGNPLTTTDALGPTNVNAFDPQNRFLAATDPLGNQMRAEYDASGRATTLRDANGLVVSRLERNAAGKLTLLADTGMPDKSFAFDASGNRTNLTYQWVNPTNAVDVRTVSMSSTYNSSGQEIRRVHADGRERRMAYDPAGQLVSVTDERGLVTRYTYDAGARQIATVQPDGHVVRSIFDAAGQPLVVSEEHRPGTPTVATRTTYDALNRPVSVEVLRAVVINVVTQAHVARTVIAAGGTVVSSNWIAYDAVGRVTSTLSASGARPGQIGRRVQYEYDAAGRRVAQVDLQGQRTEFEFAAAGRVTTLRTPAGLEGRLLYAAAGRLIRTVLPDGSSSQTSYDAAGNIASVTDASGAQRRLEYDSLRRVRTALLPAVSNPANGGAAERPRSEYSYDVNGNLASLRDPNGHVTTFGYDEHNRRVSRSFPLGQTDHQAYNVQGQLQSMTDAAGKRREYFYDALDRLTNELRYATGAGTPGEQIGYDFDSSGRVERLREARGVTEWAYDARGKLKEVASPEGTIQYEHDPDTSHRTRLGTANSDLRYTCDQLGQLRAVSVHKRHGQPLMEPEVTAYTYTSFNRRESATLPNGMRTVYGYDDNHRLTSLTHQHTNGTLTASYAYQLAPDGLRTGVVEVVRRPVGGYRTNRIVYTFDAARRLMQENASDRADNAGYDGRSSYDLGGNRLERKVTVGPVVLQTFYTYDDNDRLLMESNVVTTAASRGTGQQGLPVPDGSGGMRLQLITLPPAFNYYAWKLLPWFVLTCCLVAAGWVGRRQMRRLRLLTMSLNPMRAWFPRVLTGLLSALMVISPIDLQTLANDGILYSQLTTETWGTGGSVTTYQYDANGAVTKKVTTGANAETVEYGYDLANRLASVITSRTEAGKVVVRTENHASNARGIRVQTRSQTAVDGAAGPTSTNIFLVDMANPTGHAQVVEELEAVGGRPTVSYVIADTPISQTRDDGALTTSYLLPDGHGSTRHLADPAGGVSDYYGFDAFGLMLGGNPTPSDPVRTKILHAGEQFDAGLGHYSLRARHYDPGLV